MSPPLIVLGVRRSGTTLLRVMLDRSPGIAIPDETFFVPQIAHRHPGRVDPVELLDDLRRVPRLAAWGVLAPELEGRLRPGLTIGEALDAVFNAYAAKHGKPRWGDKTPLYMRHLGLLDRLFPDAQYVHLIRDGRDAALAFLDLPEGVVMKTWGHPRSAAGFACEWMTEVTDARNLGLKVGPKQYLEIRYEDLVADPELVMRRICTFAGLPFEVEMLDYTGAVDVAGRPHHRRLLQPPTRAVRDWRSQMSVEDTRAFESIAGELLAELGYDLGGEASAPGARTALTLGWYRTRIHASNLAAYLTQRSPLWRRRHPRLF